jgi:phage-related protein
MTSDSSLDDRVVRFLPQGTKDEYDALPEEVRDEADAATTLLQNKRFPPNAEPLKGVLNGIIEVKVNHDTNTYRVYCVTEFPYCLYIIDAEMKKSPKGSKIPREQVDRLKKRRSTAETHYKANEAYFRKTYEARKVARMQREIESQSDNGITTIEAR